MANSLISYTYTKILPTSLNPRRDNVNSGCYYLFVIILIGIIFNAWCNSTLNELFVQMHAWLNRTSKAITKN
jgi:hypothetical protein